MNDVKYCTPDKINFKSGFLRGIFAEVAKNLNCSRAMVRKGFHTNNPKYLKAIAKAAQKRRSAIVNSHKALTELADVA